jgi:SAM-dependent methyltransferase
MSGDRKIVDHNLKKYVCNRCGLVRSGHSFHGQSLENFYAHDYTLSLHPEHYFYTTQGPISRSKMLFDWMVSAMGPHRWKGARRCLEIGAGAGMLMQEFVKHFPDVNFEGIELSAEATALAKKNGLSVYQSLLSDFDHRDYDIIYSINVIEHVASPTEFLKQIHNHLNPGGWLFLCQPTQDVQSYDLFFFDHLYHFGTEHLRQYARKCGFYERGFIVGNEWMPNFSLHLWQATEQPQNFMWVGPSGSTTCLSTARNLDSDLSRLDKVLDNLTAKQHRVAVFGPGEVYWLAHAYSRLGDFPVVCGMDDRPDKPEFVRLKFPVVVPEECLSLNIQDVILTMNKIYYNEARKRLKRFGIVVHEFLS